MPGSLYAVCSAELAALSFQKCGLLDGYHVTGIGTFHDPDAALA